MLLVSLRNRYILKCVDGLFVDGKATGKTNRPASAVVGYRRSLSCKYAQECQHEYSDHCISEITGQVLLSRATILGWRDTQCTSCKVQVNNTEEEISNFSISFLCSNPLAIGQIVNNNKYANGKCSAVNACLHIHNANLTHFGPNYKVRYQEIDIPGNFPLQLRKYIPNLYLTDRSIESSWRLVALIATRRIENEELFSTYFECVYWNEIINLIQNHLLYMFS